MTQLLILICLLGLTWASVWYNVDNINPNCYSYDAYIDYNYNTHYAYCKGDRLHFLKENLRSHIQTITTFPIKGDCKTVQMSMNNSRIYIVYQTVTFCGLKDYACANIYVRESQDSGLTWSSEIPVEPSTAGVTYRYNPLIALDPTSGKIWVAYKSMGKENPTLIKMAEKLPMATQFTDHQVIATTKQNTMLPGGFAFVRTVTTKETRLHLAWQEKDDGTTYDQNIYYTNTADGKKWKTPIILGQTNLYDHNSPLSLAGEGNEIYLVYVRSAIERRGSWLNASLDNGETWKSRPLMATSDIYIGVTTKICEITGWRRLYIFAQDPILQSTETSFGFLALDSQLLSWLRNPYKDQLKDCFNPHIMCDKEAVVLSCKATTGKQDYKILYSVP